MGLVTIKSFSNGISLHLDPQAGFDELLAEIIEKFDESRKFFKNAKVALAIEDRLVTDEEEKQIICAINEHTDLDLICIVGKNPETNRRFVKALKKVEEQKEENNCRFYYGSVEAGEIVESEGSLVIFGDVSTEAAAVAVGNVVVIGSVYGQVYAGNKGDKNSIIFAMNLSADIVSIAGVKEKLKKKGLFSKKVKYNPIVINLEKDELVSSGVSDEVIKGILESNNVKNI